MSRIGNAIINVPSGVTVDIKGNTVSVKGPKGESTHEVDAALAVNIEENVITVSRSSEEKEVKAKHGLHRSLINNMVVGVSEGYKVELELVGVGYRAAAQGQNLDLSLGFSHGIMFQLPKEVSVTAVTERGKNALVTLESHDKQLIGMIAAKIRSFRKPEPYKGKGVRFVGEQIRRKAGKSASK